MNRVSLSLSLFTAISLTGLTANAWAIDAGEPCPNKAIRLRDGSCESVDYNPMRKVDFTDPSELEGEVVKPAIEYVASRTAPHFDCPVSKFNTLEAWRECMGFRPNSVILTPELSEAIYSKMECPKTLEDVEKLKKLTQSRKPEDPALVLNALNATPLNADGTRAEGHLSRTCGYNQALNKWYSRTRFASEGRIYSALSDGTRLDCAIWAPNVEGAFEQIGKNCNNEESRRNQGVVGFSRSYALTPDLRIFTSGRNPDGSDEFVYGLTITPSSTGYKAEACRIQKSLESNRDLIGSHEVVSLIRAAKLLLLKGQALDRVRKITDRIKKDSEMPMLVKDSLRSQAKSDLDLLDVSVQSIPDSLDLSAAGENACDELVQALTPKKMNPSKLKKTMPRDSQRAPTGPSPKASTIQQ